MGNQEETYSHSEKMIVAKEISSIKNIGFYKAHLITIHREDITLMMCIHVDCCSYITSKSLNMLFNTSF